MDKLSILGIGRDPVVLQKILRYLNENVGWEAMGTVDDDSAVTLFNQKKYDLVILIDHLDPSSVNRFEKKFAAVYPGVVFLQHYSDSISLLTSELEELFIKFPHLNKASDPEDKTTA